MNDNLQQPTTQGQSEEVPFGVIQHNLLNIMPTSAEINHLWSTYFAESSSVVFLKHMVKTSKDPDLHSVLQHSLDLSTQNVRLMEEIFNKIQHPIPVAFGEKDVYINAPALFEDVFSIRYMRLMTKYILLNHSMAFSDSTRSDFRILFSRFIDGAKGVLDRADEVLLAKGLYSKSPYITFPDSVKYVDDKGYYGSIFGSKRPLNVLEVSNLFAIMDFKIAIRAIFLGFAQVVKSNKLRKHFNKGHQLVDQHLQELGTFLADAGLPRPELVGYQVTDSKESPYSDKLMLFHVSVTNAFILTSFSYGLSRILRKDIISTYIRLIPEILAYAKSSTDLLIENRWLEKAPGAVDREELTH